MTMKRHSVKTWLIVKSSPMTLERYTVEKREFIIKYSPMTLKMIPQSGSIGVAWGLYNNNDRAIASYWRSTTQRGPRLRPRRVWRSIRLLRIYSVNCVFLHYGGRYARFTTFRVRIFICGPIGRKWMSSYLKNGSLDLIQTSYDQCIHERGPLRKILETLNRPIGRFLG